MAKSLWQKKLQNGKRLYVDIFDGYEFLPMFSKLCAARDLNKCCPMSRKDQLVSDAGLTVYAKMQITGEHVEQLIIQVNRMLSFAENDSEKLGLYYAFRAAHFVNIDQLALALFDIEMALKNKYPAEKRAAFEKIKADCEVSLNIIGRQDPPVIGVPKLSYPADENIPCFARGLEVKHSQEFGNHIVTNRNLEIGQTVIIEEAFGMASVDEEIHSQCANCFRRFANLIPCKNCPAVMFCSPTCHDVGHEEFHAFECGKRGVYSLFHVVQRLAMKTVIAALKLCAVKELMKVIEDFNDKKPNSEIRHPDPSIRAYMQFFGLSQGIKNISHSQNTEYIDYAKSIHLTITSDPAYKSTFRSPEANRFLGHLILHHILVIASNKNVSSTLLQGPYRAELGTNHDYGHGVDYAWAIYPNSSQLNHSCQPNIARLYIGTKLICKVLRPIKRGEQLFVTYLSPIDFCKVTAERNELLEKAFHFKCKCKFCELNLPPFDIVANADLDISICRLLYMFNEDPSKQCLIVNKEQLLRFEKSAIKFLRSNDHHPNVQTLLIQFVLMQIWNNMGC